MTEKYIKANPESGKLFYQAYHDKGKVVMLNLLKFRAVADYSGFESIKPEDEISGEEAYKLYMKHVLPLLEKAGSRVLFHGESKHFLIGPSDVTWDKVLLVEHQSVPSFIEFAEDKEYLKYAGHRTAALEDSRLLPISRGKI